MSACIARYGVDEGPIARVLGALIPRRVSKQYTKSQKIKSNQIKKCRELRFRLDAKNDGWERDGEGRRRGEGMGWGGGEDLMGKISDGWVGFMTVVLGTWFLFFGGK